MNAKKESATRLYVVRDLAVNLKEGEVAPIIALVRGISVNQVTRHMSERNFSVKYAEQTDIVAAVKAGIEEETVNAKDGEE